MLSDLLLAACALTCAGGVAWERRRRLRRDAELARRLDERELLKEAIEATPTPFSVYDQDGRLIAWNEPYQAVHAEAFRELGQDIRYGDLIRLTASRMLPPEQVEAHIQERIQAQRSGREPIDRCYPDGRWFRVFKVLTPSGGVSGFAADITELKQRERDLCQSEERYRALAEIAPVGIWHLDLAGRTRYANAAMCQLLEVAGLAQLADRSLFDFFPADLGEVPALLPPGDGPVRFETTLLGAAGSRRNVLISTSKCLADSDAGPASYMMTVIDITERKRAERQVRHLAHHDVLTGLPNRVLFVERLETLLEVARQSGRPVALLAIDLDHFKDVNDSLGHQVGDKLLQLVAMRTRAQIRTDDLPSRLGGDEFAVILDGVGNEPRAFDVAAGIVRSLSEPFEVDRHELHIGASIGVATFPEAGTSADELLRHADLALYRAKREGRGHYAAFEPSMGEGVALRRRTEDALRAALEGDQLTLLYQPQVDLASSEVRGAEALLRWRCPERASEILPADFMPAAEATGLVLGLDSWVIEAACRQAAAWRHQARMLTLSVNIAPLHFRQPDLVDKIEAGLARHDIPADALVIEITEGVLMQENRVVRDTLRNLRALGIGLAIDDFGTGCSSLQHLKQLPVDRVKIDRSFVQGLDHDSSDVAIVHAVISLAERLGMLVIAEGVETHHQLEVLRNLGCHQVQGYLFGRPMPPGDFKARLLERAGAEAVVMPAGA